jgi:D-alanyl-D-alanine carboxypeptidase (penicillin-binding protein 5/6)
MIKNRREIEVPKASRNLLSMRAGRTAAIGLFVALLCASAALVHLQAANAASPVTTKAEGFQTGAATAALLDAGSNSFLFEKNADQPFAPASLAKLMVLEYVFNEIVQGRVKLEDEYIISENAWRKGGAPSHTTTMFAAIHSRVKVSDLIQGIIVDSANDACIAIAEALAGNEGSFGALLTKRAREIGLENSVFTNSTGLGDPNAHVTARDIAELARHIMQTYPQFYPYFAARDFAWNNIRQENRNPLLSMGIGADGLKTGESPDSGYSLIGSALQDNLRLIVVVTGAKNEKERGEEAKKLLDFGFHGFETKILFAEGQTIGAAKVFGGDSGYVPLNAPGTVSLMMPRNTNDRLIARVVYSGPVPAPIAKGQAIGKLKVWRNDSVALEVPLQAADDVGTGTMPQRAMDGATELMIGLFRAGVGKL